jgi:hypothetical protein
LGGILFQMCISFILIVMVGSNGVRSRLWKLELQGFADRSGLDLFVSHLPFGTLKWNKVGLGCFVLLVRIGLDGLWWMLCRWLV